jgi:hypothetical protein
MKLPAPIEYIPWHLRSDRQKLADIEYDMEMGYIGGDWVFQRIPWLIEQAKKVVTK